MADYIITPDKKEIPSSYLLSEELHRRALAMEMEVRGTNYKWESIYFYDPLAPATQCFVERNLHSMVYKVTLTPESTQESVELQTALVEIILHEVGGKVFDPESQNSSDLKSFRNQSKESDLGFDFNELSDSAGSKSSLPPLTEMLWIAFSWALVLLGAYCYQHALPSRKIFILVAGILALISAAGITFSKIRTK
jgi:hypothetical protein